MINRRAFSFFERALNCDIQFTQPHLGRRLFRESYRPLISMVKAARSPSADVSSRQNHIQ